MSGWRVFDTFDEAQAYADEMWLALLGELGEDRTKVDYDLATKELALTLKGVDDKGNVTDEGPTVRWAEPRETAKGQWAVECPEGIDKGGDEPEWPAPPDLVDVKADGDAVANP